MAFVIVFCRQAQWTQSKQIVFKIRNVQIDELPRTLDEKICGKLNLDFISWARVSNVELRQRVLSDLEHRISKSDQAMAIIPIKN